MIFRAHEIWYLAHWIIALQLLRFALSRNIIFVAPQAPFEESATTEASRRCSLTGMLAGFRGRFGDKFLRHLRLVSAFWLSKTWPRPSSISAGSCLFACLSVCVFVQLFAGRFLDQFEQEFNCNFMKRALKKGVLATVATPNSPIFVPHPACLGRCTLLKWRLRRHLPPRPNWWRRSWWLAPVVPPAPEGSILVLIIISILAKM